MSISMELMIVIVVNVMTAGIFLGGLAMSIEQQIKRLEEKQDKHNNLVERMVKVEESTKSAHKRLDILDKKK